MTEIKEDGSAEGVVMPDLGGGRKVDPGDERIGDGGVRRRCGGGSS